MHAARASDLRVRLVDAPAHDLSGLILARIHDFDLRLAISVLDLRNFGRSVDLATLMLDARLLVEDVDVDNVVFVEFLCPPLGYAVLYLLFQDVLVWTLRKSVLHTLFVQLIKFVVEFGNHLLDVLSLFLLVQLVNYGLL